MSAASNLGYPRIGPHRELKFALESFWLGKIDEADLLKRTAALRAANWLEQKQAGLGFVPVNDFSLYDHVLDTAVMFGAIPERYGPPTWPLPLRTYFAMARGGLTGDGLEVPAMEMTKWFDANYHYIVPEFEPGQLFSLHPEKLMAELGEARALGIPARPVLVGPITFLLLGKMAAGPADVLSLLPALLPLYGELLARLAAEGVEWVQVDEPCLVIDLPPAVREAYDSAYAELANAAPGVKLLLTTYFGGLGENIDLALSLPVAGLHVDLVRAPEQLAALLSEAPPGLVLSLGLVDGRNVWRSDLSRLATFVQQAVDSLGSDRVMVAPSSSLMHTPVDLELESGLDEELKGWLAFARQKLGEVVTLARYAAEGGDGESVAAIAAATNAVEERKRSERIHVRAVSERVASIGEAMTRRPTPFADRKPLQQIRLGLPPLPTTTIGSFPQTPQIRRARAAYKEGRAAEAEYTGFLKQEIARVIAFQEDVGLDVLVHGEPERSDMVEYFAEQLEGMAITSNGWVQSYGSRCVRPPVIFGDVYRPHPMTVEWTRYAQSLTLQPVKGMLTGPITILQWSFVRDDQPRSDTCRQIALAIRDEVTDLEAAGIRVIQIDEPALREGLPLRQQDWAEYLEWAVECFRLAASGVRDDTQIHTHMCYAEFNDIIGAIADMDADVISIESSRSHMELLDAFAQFHYPNDIGPGVYDIHSPRVPLPAEMLALLERATMAITPEQLWVNPDCGLKTRRWEEVEPALRNLVAAAQQLRRRLHVTP